MESRARAAQGRAFRAEPAVRLAVRLRSFNVEHTPAVPVQSVNLEHSRRQKCVSHGEAARRRSLSLARAESALGEGGGACGGGRGPGTRGPLATARNVASHKNWGLLSLLGLSGRSLFP